MDAHVKTVREILHAGDQFLVPFFQRHYSWRKEQWERLLEDIISLTEEPDSTQHFLGPLVCTPFKPVPGEVTPYQLIDGQQRLTTVTLALAALRDVAKVNGLDSLAEEIHEDYLIHRRRTGVQRFKVVPRLEDRPAYESIVEGNPVGTTGSSGLLGAYSFFKREWKKRAEDDIERSIRKYLVAATARLSLVTITVSGENPYEIFESLNSTGLPLEEADLIRNFLFMQVPLERQEHFQRTQWDPFERRFDASDGYEKLPTTLFYRNYLMREGSYCRNKATYVEFKRQNTARNLSSTDQVEELKQFAGFELWLLRPLTCNEIEVRDKCAEIQALDITTAHPLLLHLFDKYQHGTLRQAEVIDCFRDIASFVIRRSVCGESTRGYGRLFPTAINALGLQPCRELREFLLSQGWPDDAAFIPRLVEFPLYKREKNKCRLLLEVLERQAHHKEEINLKCVNIEHVLPQVIDGNDADCISWQRALGHRWEHVHDKWVHTLGNLTLTGYNPELGNRSFVDKCSVFEESKVSLNQYFVGFVQWDDQCIRQRGLKLAEAVARVWFRPSGPDYIAPLAPPPNEPEESGERSFRADPTGGKLLIRIRWSQLNKALPDEVICENKAGGTMATFVGRLIQIFGKPMEEGLTHVEVSRRYSLSANPALDFLNPSKGKPYAHKPVPGTGLYVFTNTSNSEKLEDLRRLVRLLDFPPGSVDISCG